MFGSSPRTAPLASVSNGTHEPLAPNRLSKDVSIKGDVTFSSAMLLDGEVDGTISSSGALTIGTNGKVSGDIEAGFVIVQGSVDGNVLASERCALVGGASLRGDIESPRLVVDENSSFVGRATIKSNGH
jgi:cytoskeletal protein CcmA (bactofilin family)